MNYDRPHVSLRHHLRHSLRAPRCRQHWKLISVGAARRGCWRPLCAAVSARPSRRRSSSPIFVGSPSSPKAILPPLSSRHDAWFDRVAGAVHAFGGEVLKFIGDGILAIFPVVGDAPCGACDAALRAVSARVGMAHLDKERQGQGLPPLPFGAALHLGEMLWGNIGAADRLDFTAIGPAVNLVSRLEGLCRPLGKAVLVSGAFAAETEAPLIALGTHLLRGIAPPCAVFTLPEN